MANTKVTKAVLADDAVGLAQLHISNDPSNGQALTATSDGAGGYNLTWANNTVAGISSSADSTAITIDASENVAIGTSSAFGTTSNRTCVTVNGTNSVSLNIGTGGSQRGYMYSDGNSTVVSSVGSIPLKLGVADQNKTATLNTSGQFSAENIYNGGSSGNKKTVVNFPCTSSYPNTSTYTFSLSATEAPIGSWVILGIRITSGNSGGDQYAYLEQNNDKGNRQMNYVDSWYYNDASASMYYISAASDRNFTLNHATIVATNTNDWREVYYWGYVMDN